MNIIEKAILYYRDNGKTGERFGDMVERIGFEEVSKGILGNEILKEKEEILKAEVHTKRNYSC